MPKVKKQLEKGLGKVLSIDEAHSLAMGTFGKEAVNELVGCMTKPRFAGEMVIILAGYDKDMNDLLKINPGLSSRFEDEFSFPALSPTKCLEILNSKVKESRITIPSLDIASEYAELLDLMKTLSEIPGWGSARDVIIWGR